MQSPIETNGLADGQCLPEDPRLSDGSHSRRHGRTMPALFTRTVAKRSAPIVLAALAVLACHQGSPHDLVRQLGNVPLDPRIANDEVDWDQVIAEIGIDSIAYEEGKCGTHVRYSLVLTHTGVAHWVGEISTVLPGEWDAPFPQLDFIRLADFIRAEELEGLANDESPDAIDGYCYRLRVWEEGRNEPLKWSGRDYPGGDQRLWMLRSAVAGMALRIRWDLAPANLNR